ncbi:MAG: hypothetical protein LBU25_09785, partial [Treponema sp.]|nr:hypothetical protein [Treponema sp.]
MRSSIDPVQFGLIMMTVVTMGIMTHMRLLRDEQPVKRREPFPFRISTKTRNLMYVFKHIRYG